MDHISNLNLCFSIKEQPGKCPFNWQVKMCDKNIKSNLEGEQIDQITWCQLEIELSKRNLQISLFLIYRHRTKDGQGIRTLPDDKGLKLKSDLMMHRLRQWIISWKIFIQLAGLECVIKISKDHNWKVSKQTR